MNTQNANCGLMMQERLRYLLMEMNFVVLQSNLTCETNVKQSTFFVQEDKSDLNCKVKAALG